MADVSKKILFEEKQHFRQPWIWLLLLIISCFLTYGLTKQLFWGINFGSKPTSDFVLILIWFIFALGLPYGLWKSTLTTRIYADGIGISFFPIHFSEKFYGFDQIIKTNKVTYRPILDYGGWGIRFSKKGKAYNIHGKKGIKLWLKSRKPILIGSQQPDKLYTILQNEIE